MSEGPADVTASVRRALAVPRALRVPEGTAESLGPERARQRTRTIWAGYWSARPVPVERVSDHLVPTPVGDVAVRVYDPRSASRSPLVYVHGGGFVLGDLDTHDVIPRHLALLSGHPVVSVDYRLAPDHPYPAALLDIVGVVEAIAANTARLELEGRGLMLGGDSAGANLALGAAMRLRGNAAAPSGLLLLFGCYDPAMKGSSFASHGTGYGLSTSDVGWFWRQYLKDRFPNPPEDAAPLGADLAALPPVYLGVPACDPLCSDSEALHSRLLACGVAAEFRRWPGMIHGCIGMVRELNEAYAQLADAAVWIASRRSAAASAEDNS